MHCIVSLAVRIVPYCTPRGNTVRTADRMYCAAYCIVSPAVYHVVSYCALDHTVQGLLYVCIVSLVVRIVPYCAPRRNMQIVCTVRGLLYMIVCIVLRFVSYRTVLCSLRKYITNRRSYVLCGLLYCITRGVTCRIVLFIGSYCAGFAVCMYCIARGSYRTVLYSPKKYADHVLCGVCRT
jgi:hypothetical protein